MESVCRLVVRRCWVALSVAMVVVSGFVGCTRQAGEELASPAPATPPDARADRPAPPSSPRAWIDAMLARYAQCQHYHDQWEVTLEYSAPASQPEPTPASPAAAAQDHPAAEQAPSRVDRGPQRETTQFSLDFVRDTGLRLQVTRGDNRLQILSDRRKVWAWIDDPATHNLREQIVERTAPAQWTIADIYSATEMIDPTRPQEMLSVLLGVPVNLQFTPMGLVLPDPAWKDIVARATSVTELSLESIDGHACHRIALATEWGTYGLWIDANDFLLRRIDYPTESLFQQLPVEQRPAERRLTAVWQKATWEPPPDVSFVAPRNERSQWVRYFVLPPTPLATQRLGEPVSGLRFTSLDDAASERTLPTDRDVVLLWFQDHPTSREAMRQVDAVARRAKAARRDVEFVAICSDPIEQQSNQQVADFMQSISVDLPVVRDTRASGRDHLQVLQAPTTVVLDKQQRVQLLEVGANPQLEQLLMLVLDRLAKGEDVSVDVRRQAEAEEKTFVRQLELARLQSPELTEDSAASSSRLTPQYPAARSFQRLHAKSIWQTREIKLPGNVVCLASGAEQPATSAVLDGRSTMWLVDAQGKIDKHFDLASEADDAMTQIGVAELAGQRYFYTFARLGSQVLVIDGAGRKVFQYPPRRERHAMVQDVVMADLDRDETLELYVGFGEPLGVHGVDLRGERRWTNRATAGVASLATYVAPSGEPFLLAVDAQGPIRPLNSEGRDRPPFAQGARTFHALVRAPSASSRPAQYVALSYSLDGRQIAVGLNEQLGEVWSYGLPAGAYATQVHGPRWFGPWEGDAGVWLLAGPDGSVHLIQDDGSFHDVIYFGHDVTGLALEPRAQQSVLIVAHGDVLEGLLLEKNAR